MSPFPAADFIDIYTLQLSRRRSEAFHLHRTVLYPRQALTFVHSSSGGLSNCTHIISTSRSTNIHLD